MTDACARVREQVDAWRAQGADRLDPVRFHLLDAMERRASRVAGEARRVLDARLSSLAEEYARLVGAASRTDAAPMEPAPTPLGDLQAHIAQVAGRNTTGAWPVEAPLAFPLDVLDEFRRIWTTVRTESQMRQSMEPAPENAGPLNGSALVHRSIALMRELSPGYLQQFLAYLDDLSWIEQLHAGRATTPRDTGKAPAARKRSRARAPRD